MTSQTDAGARVVRTLHDAYNRRDREALLACLHEHVVWEVAGDNPMAGTFEGRSALWEAYLDPMWASPARVRADDVVEHGEHVVALVEWLHDFGEGERAWKGVEVFRLEDGVVAERREFVSGQAELDELIARGCAAALDDARLDDRADGDGAANLDDALASEGGVSA